MGCAARSRAHLPVESWSTRPETPSSARGLLSSPCLKLMRPPSTIMRYRRAVETIRVAAGGPTNPERDELEEAGGNHCSMFHLPSLLRTRFRLGRERERVPNSKRPESNAGQRSPALKVSARRKYSRPKRGSSEMVMEFASSRAPSSRLKSNRPTSTGRPKLASRCAIRYLRAALVRNARESPKLAANSAMARMKIQRSHFRLCIVRPRIAAKGQWAGLPGRADTLVCPLQYRHRTRGQAALRKGSG